MIQQSGEYRREQKRKKMGVGSGEMGGRSEAVPSPVKEARKAAAEHKAKGTCERGPAENGGA